MRIFAISGVVLMLAGAASAQQAADVGALSAALKINPASTAALAELEALAAEGNARAALAAAGAYRGGFGAERDLDRAGALAARAGELGSNAGFMLQGDIIRQAGRGSDEAIAAARPFWEQAVALGNPVAMVRLAEVDAPAVVVKVQNALSDKGFDAGVADGVIGPKTLGALGSFCAQADIAEACSGAELTSLPVLRAVTRAGLFKDS